MRAAILSVALVLPLAAGCLTAETEAPIGAAAIPLASIEVPDGAELLEENGSAVLRWADVALPFSAEVTIPAGATIVRAVGRVADDLPVSASMANAETGRRRCNTDYVDAWDLGVRGASTCSGLAAIDPPGAKWTVRVTASAPGGGFGFPVAPAVPALKGAVDVVFETTPLDGLAGRLDLSLLSMPTHNLTGTQYLKVPSWDGTPLHVEVTLPEGEGPWPAVLASSPYNGQYGREGNPAMWTYFTHDWAKRGYAVVNADVRGFGLSGGCVEVWGTNEQKDQAFLVDWIAQQEWSDGRVGFYGQSYVGTTPVEAAVQAPEALKAIIAVAPVINAYYDWHHGGVPNGESTGSPIAYQVLTDVPPTDPDALMDPLTVATNKGKGLCDPTLIVRANDPRAVYDAFYEERNFSARAQDVTAAVLYTQGFEDANVKSAMIPGWFNEIRAPKLGLFGHWVHQHPTRADEEVVFLGWMDQWVKGLPLGFDRIDPVEVVVDDATFRAAAEWPPTDAALQAWPADVGGARLALAPAPLPLGPAGEGVLVIPFDVANDTALAGVARLAVSGTLLPAGNAHFFAALYDEGPDGRALMTYGGFNLAHRGGHDQWTPSAPGERTSFELPFLPTEHVFRAGHKLVVVLSGVGLGDLAPEATSQPGAYEIAEATLLLPTIAPALYGPAPATATP